MLPASLLQATSAAPIEEINLQLRQIHPVDASNVDAALAGVAPRNPKHRDTAHGTEIVPRRPRIPYVRRDLAHVGQKPKLLGIDYPVNCSRPCTQRAIAL